jgi:hypothetical protein
MKQMICLNLELIIMFNILVTGNTHQMLNNLINFYYCDTYVN